MRRDARALPPEESNSACGTRIFRAYLTPFVQVFRREARFFKNFTVNSRTSDGKVGRDRSTPAGKVGREGCGRYTTSLKMVQTTHKKRCDLLIE